MTTNTEAILAHPRAGQLPELAQALARAGCPAHIAAHALSMAKDPGAPSFTTASHPQAIASQPQASTADAAQTAQQILQAYRLSQG